MEFNFESGRSHSLRVVAYLDLLPCSYLIAAAGVTERLGTLHSSCPAYACRSERPNRALCSHRNFSGSLKRCCSAAILPKRSPLTKRVGHNYLRILEMAGVLKKGYLEVKTRGRLGSVSVQNELFLINDCACHPLGGNNGVLITRA